jgi:gallate decarboxylase subunit D
MKSIQIHEGKGRTQVSLSNHWIGTDLILCIFNDAGHIGAVAVAEYCHQEDRPSTSVLTRFGHKDDSIASNTARIISKAIKQPVCVIAGIHVDNITDDEIAQIIQNCGKLANTCIRLLTQDDRPIRTPSNDRRNRRQALHRKNP